MAEQPKEPVTHPPPDPVRLGEEYRRIRREMGVAQVREVLEAVEEEIDHRRDASGRSLTEKELDLVAHRGEVARAGQGGPGLLLLIVGYSPEPLLLAAVYHQPREVVLLKSRDLENDYLRRLGERWDRFAAPRLPQLPKSAALLRDGPVVRDTPEDLFRAVARATAEARGRGLRPIVLDITGAKKTMVAGAFLAAGHLGIETSYVDFERYDSVLRRPEPGTPRPGLLPHPAQLFRLGERRELASLFEAGRYEEVRRLAEALAGAAGSSVVRQVLGEEEAGRQGSAFSTLAAIAGAYQLWADGFYRDAAEAIRALPGLPMPPQVAQLAGCWPSWRQPEAEIVAGLAQPRVFADPATTLQSLLELLLWWPPARREEAPRLAFLRLYGGLEALFFFTFDRLVARRLSLADLRCKNADALKDLERELPRDEQGKTLDWQQLLVAGAIESCRNDSGLALAAAKGETRRFAPYLREVPGLAERLGKRLQTAEELVPSVKIRLQDSPLPPSAHNQLIFKAEDELTLQRFRSLRNKAVHWLAPVPASTAHDLAKLFAKAANFLLPLVSEQVERDLEGRFAELRGFREWAAYLDRAARGDVAQELRPLSFSEVAARVGLELEMSEDGKGAG